MEKSPFQTIIYFSTFLNAILHELCKWWNGFLIKIDGLVKKHRILFTYWKLLSRVLLPLELDLRAFKFFQFYFPNLFLVAQEEGEARWGNIPRLNITVYLQTIFEPHNALVHVSQNFLNFCMGTIFWLATASVYYRVNPVSNNRNDDYYYDRYNNYD